MSKNSKRITVKVKNKELNALEDYLTIEMTDAKRKKCRNLILDLWARLCGKYDEQ